MEKKLQLSKVLPNELLILMGNIIANKFYGELIIKFEAGKIVHCKKSESIKIAQA